jgi:uncharacterized membrane protein
MLVLAIIGAIATLGYVIATPKVGERFTEFYILGMEEKAENYPKEFTLGEEGRVILGIVNREHEAIEYKVEITIGGEKVGGIGPTTLEHEEKWEREIGFTPTRAGLNQKVEFLLYKGASSELYQILQLGLDVKEGS